MKLHTKEQAESFLLENINNDVKMLSNFFQMAGFKLYCVGGAVRDSFYGIAPKDYDLCTNAMPNDVIALLTDADIKCDLIGERFAVVMAKMEEGAYEIATFRSDISYADNRHPEVKIGVTIEEDVKRRDFTINAMFFDLETRTIIDLVGGEKDLRDRLIRCVGNARERFEEDHLRKLRAIRFACKMDFAIDGDTWDAIKERPMLSIDKESIYKELCKAHDYAIYKQGLAIALYESGIMFLPGLNISKPSMLAPHGSLECMVADLLRDLQCSEQVHKTISKTLVQTYGFDVRTAKGVEYLFKFASSDIESFDPLKFHNDRAANDITDHDILIYNSGDVKSRAFLQFKPTEGIAERFMKDGLAGPELGKAIRAHHVTEYKKIVESLSVNSLQ